MLRYSIKRILLLSCCVIVILLPWSASAGTELKRFEASSYVAILEAHSGRAFLMVLWSLDCPPCFEELPVLGNFHKLHPDVSIVMVSTDSMDNAEEIGRLMRSHGLDDIQQWVFGEGSARAIRFAIDPLWYGELPRSYFHMDDHQRHASSGRLNEKVLLAWTRSMHHRGPSD